MSSTISKQEIIERVTEGYFRDVLAEREDSINFELAQLDQHELVEYLMSEFTVEELQLLWQNYVLRISPTASARELQSRIIETNN